MQQSIDAVQEIAWPSHTFILKRAKLNFDKLSSFFAKEYKGIYDALAAKKVTSSEPPFAIYFSVDPGKKETDLAAAVAVPGKTEVPEGFSQLTIPASRALKLIYYGPYEGLTRAYAQIDQYAEEKGLKKVLALEQYFSDPVQEPDPARWRTDIYYIL